MRAADETCQADRRGVSERATPRSGRAADVFTGSERILEAAPTAGGPGAVTYAVLYPNRHAVGMANLGLQTVAGLLAGLPGALCHRAFTDCNGTLEAGRGLGEYHVVALTLSFEGDYAEALRQLATAGIPLRSEQREARDPLVVVGGVAPTLNPEPLAPFADAVFLGEAEAGLAALHRFLSEHLHRPRPELLAALADAALPGVYVPSRYRVTERGADIEREPLGDAPARVERTWATLPWSPARSRILAENDAFGGAYLLEIGRGCPHACRFCATGYLTRPVRFLPSATLLPWIEAGVAAARRIGFVSAAVSNHPELEALFEATLEAGGGFTVSSFRAESLTPRRLDLLQRGGLRTLTVALEAGTAELRRSLGKNLDEEQLLHAAALAGEAGLDGLRIYAMVGLPGERDEDVEALAELGVRARRALGRGTVTLSVAPFVPKPHTPLQWASMVAESDLRRRIRLLQSLGRRERGVKVTAETPKGARVQGLISRGGRAVADALEGVARGGNWRQVLQGELARQVLDRPWDVEAPLPWGFVGGTPDPVHLKTQYHAGSAGGAVSPCHPGVCRVCGVCSAEPGNGGENA